MNFTEKLLIALGVILTTVIVAFLGGTIVYWIWPVTFPVIFPNAVASGILIAKIPWWSAVCTTWICAILIKSSSTSSINKSEQ